MITKFLTTAFKSLAEVTIELGQINVFIGANGSGKSNLLEALGVLSAAASGRVDDESLIRRGIRPGAPRLYKCALKNLRGSNAISFRADLNSTAFYSVSLLNPIEDPKPAWRYQTESWEINGIPIVGRSNRSKEKFNPSAGLAALKAVERAHDDDALFLLDILRGYSIYSPNTPTLRGLMSDPQNREPIGLSGGNLPNGLNSLQKQAKTDPRKADALEQVCELIDWAFSFDSVAAHVIPFSSSITTSKQIIRFTDRFMVKERNTLSGADVSEGALYILFMAVLALEESSPQLLAIDNADHGLNPRLARTLMQYFCEWVLHNPQKRQFLLTTQNPLVLDGLPLQDDRVRLFAVDRAESGKTIIRRVKIGKELIQKTKQTGALSRLWVMGHLGGVPNV